MKGKNRTHRRSQMNKLQELLRNRPRQFEEDKSLPDEYNDRTSTAQELLTRYSPPASPLISDYLDAVFSNKRSNFSEAKGDLSSDGDVLSSADEITCRL